MLLTVYALVNVSMYLDRKIRRSNKRKSDTRHCLFDYTKRWGSEPRICFLKLVTYCRSQA
jgi:hypothetical protein